MVAVPAKTKKSPKSDASPEDIDLLKSDVASFASSLGLAASSSAPSAGFNDSDFRKKGAIKLKRAKKEPISVERASNDKSNDSQMRNLKGRDKPNPRPKPPVLSVGDDDRRRGVKGFDKFRNLPKLPLVKATALGVWYEDAAELEAKVIGEEGMKKPLQVKDAEEWKRFAETKREMGERLMAQFASDYESSRGQSGDIKMLIATQRSGTVMDKVSSFSIMIGDNPVANLRSLDGLVGMVTSKVGKRHALTGFDVLREIFKSLLPDRKLKTLLQRPLKLLPDTNDGNSLLLLWYWEECLKQRYERFVLSLDEASRDMLPLLKNKALKTIYELLTCKSEQERKLLSALVNKLGDPQSKGASNAEFLLSKLLSEHPNMKAVVIDEVDTLLFRPRLGLRAKYHAVNFLCQVRLSNRGDGPKVAKRLIDVYFALFKLLISEARTAQEAASNGKNKHKKASAAADDKNEEGETHVELDSRILSALLTGVNRAFPFVSSAEADDIVEVQTPLLFQLVHSKNFNIGVQALMLLDKISSKNQIVSDRFYRALYSKLLLPAAMNTSKVELFIGLLLRAMKNDVNLKRVAAFSKRLLQVALQQPPQYACGYLFLLSELLKARPQLWNMVQQNELVDEELEHFEDIKEDSDAEVLDGSKEQQRDVESHDAEVESFSSEEEEEVVEDDPPVSSSEDEIPEEGDDFLLQEIEENGERKKSPGDDKHQANLDSSKSVLPGGYNPRHREPSYSNADRVSWWELSVLASHAHPSVSTMARTLLSGANIVYNGNPLHDLSLTAFLEKLMDKKPKTIEWHGGSQIEPAKKLDMSNRLIGPELLSLAETDVPPEDVVFHRFYLNKMNSTKKQKKKKKKVAEEEGAEELFDMGSEEIEGGDESDNEEIEDMLDAADDVLEEKHEEYDYDDLDRVAFDDDDDLIDDASDAEDLPFDVAEEDEIEDDDDKRNDVDIGDADDGSEDNEESSRKRKSGKKSRKSGTSPFASLEDYEHLMNDDTSSSKPKKESKKKHKKAKNKSKSPKKKVKTSK